MSGRHGQVKDDYQQGIEVFSFINMRIRTLFVKEIIRKMARKKLASCCFKLLLVTSLITWSTVLSLDSSPGKQSEELSIGGIVDLTTHIGKEERAAMQVAIEDLFSGVDLNSPTLLVKDSRGEPTRAFSSGQISLFSVSLENKELTLEERNLLSMAYKNVIGARRASWRIISSIEQKEGSRGNKDHVSVTRDYRAKIETELSSICDEILKVLDSKVIPVAKAGVNAAKNLIKKNHVAAIVGLRTWPETFFVAEVGNKSKVPIISLSNEVPSWSDSNRPFLVNAARGQFAQMKAVADIISGWKWRKVNVIYEDINSAVSGIVPYLISALQDAGAEITYDAMRAVSLALTDGVPRSKSFQNSTNNSLMLSISGEKIVSRISESNFEGLAGAFNFQKGILSPESLFRIINVVGRSYREIGYWTENLGFSESTGAGSKYSKSMSLLGQVFWPGGPWSVPRGWALPTSAEPLKIGVPVSNSHKEFVDVVYDQLGRGIVVKGFSINVFDATLKFLPYYLPHIFVPFNGTYDSLVEQVKLQNYDAVVADTAIVAKRFQCGEFSQPYADSGLQMLIIVRTKNINRAWLFTKPFSTSMWITIGIINIYNGFVVWLIERNDERNRDAEIRRGSLLKQIGYMLYSAFKTLFSLNVDNLSSNLSRIVMVVWLFLALVLTQSFTASLSAIFSYQGNDPATVDVETLRNTGAKIGCDGGSFVVAYLRDVLNIHPDNIVRIYSEDDYAQALINEEIAAAYLEVPYLKVFLAKYCKGFTTSGPIYKVGGFGFVSIVSPLTPRSLFPCMCFKF
ncbi:hypothetical protein DKX38_020103 [Salix brachista]|uniref:Glutamate receptor n=1 Tax=Salix brachista TaxID=2182728 RepID=A0A5N5KI30_9ROSI|nr:hypothetical protein DKX38_020103 [Salix brachista]